MPESKHSVNPLYIKYFDIVKIHWKVQAIVHFLLSFPIAFLTVFSWGIPVPALARLTVAYLDLYFFIYFPLYYFLPRLTLLPVKKEINKLNAGEQLSDAELSHLVSYLMNLPLPVSILTALIEFSAFTIGAYVWTTGLFVPELLKILNIALFETFILGVVVAINVAFLNIIMVETYIRSTVEKITHVYPQAFDYTKQIRKVSMYTKVFFLILLTTFAGELSILIFFSTFILSTVPAKFFENAAFVVSVMLINVLYIFILAPIVAGNFTTPINKLVDWIREITAGNLESRIRFITNDETGDIIRGSNLMIDRLKKSHDVIELEKNKLTTVLFGVIDGVIALDSQKRVTLMNKAAEEITGWSCEESTGHAVDTILNLTDENELIVNSTHYCPPLNDEMKISGRYSHANLKLITKKGQEKYINITCSTISQKIGTDTTYILTFHDTTGERQLEHMKLDFVSMAAHELRTPVTVIRGYLDVFLDENKARLDNNQSNMISRVYESSRQLASLIDSLLNVSKIEKGTLHLNIENIDWRLYVQDVVKSFKYLTHEKGQKLELVISDSFHDMVDCDRLRVSEILGNLINNAITYTPPGGTIRVIVESQRDSVITHIQDTGQGIPESALPRLFTKFFRVAHTLESSSEGNGLGLYLSKAIVEMHNGKIWVESQVGRGSTFSFSLPKKQPAV